MNNQAESESLNYRRTDADTESLSQLSGLKLALNLNNRKQMFYHLLSAQRSRYRS